MITSRCKLSNLYLADVNIKKTNVQVVYQYNLDLSTHCSAEMRCHVAKIPPSLSEEMTSLMRYWIKPTAVSKRNNWILQEVLHSNKTSSPLVKGNSFWSTRVTRNSTIKILATVRCDTLINKILHVKKTSIYYFQRC